MEISRINTKSSITSDKKNVASRKDFSQSFSFAKEKKNEQQLKNMLDEIKKKGNRLTITKCYVDVKAYKNMIKEYLQSVLDYMYSIKKDTSFWQTQYFITIETVDTKLEDLTKTLLENEKESLNIASTIDEITGLVVDLYKQLRIKN